MEICAVQMNRQIDAKYTHYNGYAYDPVKISLFVIGTLAFLATMKISYDFLQSALYEEYLNRLRGRDVCFSNYIQKCQPINNQFPHHIDSIFCPCPPLEIVKRMNFPSSSFEPFDYLTEQQSACQRAADYISAIEDNSIKKVYNEYCNKIIESVEFRESNGGLISRIYDFLHNNVNN